ncbi:DEAD/DEAH box helicase [Lapillicoccus jejuensis]|uniref:RNA helicase n=1 Tax=Lapillicoccus jejuensis TaxID=402171 RepID=A0A542DW71_9MICO|nr:DEAD/DEAH box helicase [Lapillicoccus jejuensis]TQJ07337.1 superfamily II DNA/RNA helicase [Lapillicoccus jejuensis]
MTDLTEATDQTDVAEAADAPQGAAVPAPEPTFADFPVHPDIVAALAEHGIVTPFPIQAMTLPVALGGHDIIGQAKTGTGKTLGFGVPLLQRVVSPADEGFDALPAPGKPQALVVAPTRELAVQVSGDLERAGAKRGIRVLTVYGGRAYEPQIEALKNGVEVVVGTPGRLIDLAKQKYLDLSRARTVVLDEADEMLDLGFLPDVETLMAQTSPQRQTMLFSATMPGAIVALARRYMSQPTHIRAMGDDQENAHTVKAVTQHVYRAHALDKVEMLARILQADGRGLALVFTRTKRTAAKVAEELTERGYAAAAIHGDLGQGAREQALRAFRNGKVDVLVATDVAARGIDVDNVTHVVNYQCPEDEKTYVHRIGRTARAGNTGTAVTFVDWDDMPRWGLINRQLDLGIPEPVETYSSSEHLYTDLSIPADAKGRLRRSEQTRAGLDAEELEDLGETGKGAGRRGPSARGGRGERTERSEPSERPQRAPRERSRRRTTRVDGAVLAEGGEAGEVTAQSAPRTDGVDAEGGSGDAPKRRRRRGGRGRSGKGAGEAAAPAEG